MIDNTQARIAQLEQQLQVNESQLRALVMDNPHGICIVDTSGRSLFLNPAAEALLGRDVGAELDLPLTPGAPRQIELTGLDGQRRTVELRVSETAWEGASAWLVTLIDVTLGEWAEDALRQRAGLLRTIIETARDSIFVKDTSLRYVQANPAIAALFEMDLADVLGKTDQDLFGDQAAAHIAETDRRVLAGETVESFPSRIVRGVLRYFHAVKVPLHDDQGNITGLFGIARDVTDRVQAEEALRETQDLLKKVQAISRVGGWQYDVATKRVTWTDEVYRIYGVDRDHDPNDIHHNLSLYAPEHAPLIKEAFQRAVEKGEPYDLELEIVRVDGERIWVRTIGRPVIKDGQVVRVTGNFIDITERVRVEETRREHEQELAAIYENAPVVMMLVDGDRRVRKVNGFAVEFAGRPAEEMLGLRGGEALRCLHALDDPAGCGFGPACAECSVRRAVTDTFETGRSYHQVEACLPFSIAGQQQEMFFFLSTTRLQIRGEPMVLVSIMDITARMRAEEALRQLKELNEGIVQNVTEGIMMTDVKGRITFVNPALAMMMGYAPEELIGQSWIPLVSPEQRAIARAADARRVAGHSDRYEIELRRSDGTAVSALVSGSPRLDPDTGRFAGTLAVFTDITAQKQAEDMLQTEREQLFALFDSIDQAIYVTDPKSYQVLFVNQHLKNLLGHDPTDGICYREFQGLDQPCPFCTNDIIFQQPGQTHTWEHHNPTIDRDYLITDKAIKWPNGRDVRFEIAIDITEPKRAETAIKRQLQELTALSAVASACAQATDEDRLIADLTELMSQALYPEDLGLFMLDAAEGVLRPHPSYRQSAGKPNEFIRLGDGMIGRAAQEGQSRRVADVLEEPDYIQASPITRSELAVPIKIGERVIAVINAESSQPGFFTAEDERLLSTVAGQLATAIERIRLDQETQRRLIELEALHRASREVMAAGTDPERVYASVHQVVAELMPCEAFVITLHNPVRRENEAVYLIDKGGRWPTMRIPVDQGLSGQVIAQGETVILGDLTETSEAPGIHFGSPESVRSILAVPLRIGERVIGMLSTQSYQPHVYTGQDRVLLETLANHVAAGLENIRLFQKTREQARRVEGILNTVPEGVLLLDADQRVLAANPAARRDLALLTSAGVGDVITHLGDRPLTELFTSPPEGLWHEIKVGARIFEAIARPIENGPEPERWVVVISEATQARAVSKQLAQQERLATVGQLAAGIAHDFNNILASITLYTHLSLRNPEIPPEIEERMRVILAEANSAANLVQQILDFSRRAAIERKPLDLRPLLKEQMRLLKRTLPEHIEVELVYGEEEYTIHADPTRVQQVIVNLALNARDAMPDGGVLRIALRRVSGGERVRCVTCGSVTEGAWIEVTVTDTGSGIRPEVLPRIFEPFFTTRAPLGHGLGLAQVYGIVKQHEGHLDVETELGVGSTFRLYWPALPAAGMVYKEPSATLTTGHGETILVVEDDNVLRAALIDSLEALDYAVLKAENGRQALELLELHQHEIALVLSDWVMPAMGGLALAHEMEARFPEIRVLMLTGHPLGETVRAAVPAGVIGWMRKPINLEELAAAVAQALAGRDPLCQ